MRCLRCLIERDPRPAQIRLGPVRNSTLNLDIPPGKWKSVRLKNLPKETNIAVQVVSNGEIIVALVDSKNYQRFSETSRPLFAGRVEKQLSFSLSIPEKGDYFVVLDNRAGQESRAAKVTVRAAPAAAKQKKSAEKILTDFERQLLRIFVFNPFPIGTRKCGSRQCRNKSPSPGGGRV